MDIWLVIHEWGDDGSVHVHRTLEGAKRTASQIVQDNYDGIEDDDVSVSRDALDEIKGLTPEHIQEVGFMLDLGEPVTLVIKRETLGD